MLIAHGVGSRGDLPLPMWMFIWAAAIALVISFVALGALWTEPRLAAAGKGRILANQGTVGRAITVVLQLSALALFLTALWAGLFGTNDTDQNLLPVALYIVVWVGMQVVSGLVGDLWRVINPLATLATVSERISGVRTSSATAERFGHWPAAAGLVVFLFYELAHPTGSQPRTLGWMLLVHTAVCMALGVRLGANWVRRNEPFSALFTMLAGMAPLASTDQGELRVRPPLTGLATMSMQPGSLAVLLVVIGGTTFDGFSESELGRDVFGSTDGWSGAAVLGLGLLASIGLVAALFAAGIWWTKRVTDRSGLADAFAPSLVPIAFGYGVAHYAQLLVDETQTFIFRLSDPGGFGWDLFGGADGQIDFTLVSSDVIAWIQVLAVLFGHVGAVIVAHDRSVELFSLRESLRSQYAMLLVMVAYSTLGLWLLLNA